ncbi:MAG: hypothetical protein FWH31_01960 [Streptococcaceae bacterium]|nr:hypothetical protein [Streptococcaceae bacterium]
MSNNYQARTRKKRMTPLLILTGLIAILFAAGGFTGNRKNGVMGTVSTISSSSITIKTR